VNGRSRPKDAIPLVKTVVRKPFPSDRRIHPQHINWPGARQVLRSRTSPAPTKTGDIASRKDSTISAVAGDPP